MQGGGVAVRDTYQVSGRVFVNGTDVGASVEAVSVDRDIPSGMPSDTSFRSASGTVTATVGVGVAEMVSTPWRTDGVWPPKPMDDVEVVLSDGARQWTQFKGHVSDVSGHSGTRTVTFTVQDNYQSLDRPARIPALSSMMPALEKVPEQRFIGLESTFITDWVLRAAGRYATPPRAGWNVVSATLQGSMWPERGTLLESRRLTSGGQQADYPSWHITDYGLCASNVQATYEPTHHASRPSRITEYPVELTQEIIAHEDGEAGLYCRFPGGGMVVLYHTPNWIRANYYTPDNEHVVLVSVPKEGKKRASAHFYVINGTLYTELRSTDTQGNMVIEGAGEHSVGSTLNGTLEWVRVRGTAPQGAFQVSFPGDVWASLAFEPNAIIHATGQDRNALIGIPEQLDRSARELLDEQATAEFAQYWIDEMDTLHWWDRGLLAQRSSVGTLTGSEHVKALPWSHNYDSVKHQVSVKFVEPSRTLRRRTNLTLWQGRGETLEGGDDSEIFINVPDDEIWLGVDYENWVRYSNATQNFDRINQGRGTVLGGIRIDADGHEYPSMQVMPSIRRVTDSTYVVETSIGENLSVDEQAALQFVSEQQYNASLRGRWLGEKLPILRGKVRITLTEESRASQVTGPSNAPDYEHAAGFWIQEAARAGRVADYAAASLTQPRPTVEALDIMPVFNLQVGDMVIVHVPEAVGLEVRGVVTSNNISANFPEGSATQRISLLPTAVRHVDTPIPPPDEELSGVSWEQFGAAHSWAEWWRFGESHRGYKWGTFGGDPLATIDRPVTYEWAGARRGSHSIQRTDGIETGRNLIPNPSFEFSTNHLLTAAGIEYLSVITWPRIVASGSWGLTIRTGGATASNARVSQQVQLPSNTPGRWAGFTVAARQSTGATHMRLYAVIDGSVQYFTDYVALTFDPNEGNRYGGALQLPEGVDSFEVGMHLYGSGDGAPPADGITHTDAWMLTMADNEADALVAAYAYFDGDTLFTP